ncbi:uncharacterized protein K02A2.6-like [Anneissia japonica]|uniref:uncharacterized protein K02A2.6-like n=1 Tax=Anneissia japonica TaxID=1529436 RepID=UPI0014257563|nr:uncharacterized protein K02A2.6-like [Anneissia japonica]
MASARIQRWALKLANYSYTLQYRPGVQNGNADGLSRLPLATSPATVPVPEEVVFAMALLDGTPVTASLVAKWTARDPVLSAVVRFILQDWPSQVGEEYRPFHRRNNELSVQKGCVLWGSRVIIPVQGRERLLAELHDSHPGMVRMKALARSYLWWLGLDLDIETTVRGCTVCQQHGKVPPRASLHSWEWPGKPWYRIHIDYAGPFEGKMILVIVDAHS